MKSERYFAHICEPVDTAAYIWMLVSTWNLSRHVRECPAHLTEIHHEHRHENYLRIGLTVVAILLKPLQERGVALTALKLQSLIMLLTIQLQQTDRLDRGPLWR